MAPDLSTHAEDANSESDAELVQALRTGAPGAAEAFFARYQGLVNRLVWRFLGADRDHDDLVHQVFIQALTGVRQLVEGSMLRNWLMTLTINTVRSELRRRKVRNILTFSDTAGDHEFAPSTNHEARAALGQVYELLNRFSADERMLFVLRHVEEEKLEHLAEAFGCSLATIKRRLRSVSERFLAAAAHDPLLASYVTYPEPRSES